MTPSYRRLAELRNNNATGSTSMPHLLAQPWKPLTGVWRPLAANDARAGRASLFNGFSQLAGKPLPQANAYAMIQRRARAAGITTRVGNHTFRATGVTAYLKNGGMLRNAGNGQSNGESCQYTHDAAL